MTEPRDMLFRTLADPTRRAIFERLCREGEKTVGALTATAGISQPAVSKHLAVLKAAGLVHMHTEGRQSRCRADPAALAEPLWDEQDLDEAIAALDGFSLIRSLRKFDPKVRVIVSTGHCDTDQQALLSRLGVGAILDKPYNATKLLRSLRDMLRPDGAIQA